MQGLVDSQAHAREEYLSQAPGGELYELAPSTQTIARTLHRLLVGQGREWGTMSDLAAFWNALHGAGVVVSEERQIKRSVVSEGSRIEALLTDVPKPIQTRAPPSRFRKGCHG